MTTISSADIIGAPPDVGSIKAALTANGLCGGAFMANHTPIPTDPRFKDLTGLRFGRLVVSGYAGVVAAGAKVWDCRCDCGAAVVVRGGLLSSGKTQSCGCLRREVAKREKHHDLTGTQYGRLVVVGRTGRRQSYALWRCRCECGAESTVTTAQLTSGKTQSCGCLARGNSADRKTTHGLSKTPEYRTWVGMMARCYNESREDFQYYGGKGVKVCDRWHRVESFIADMGERPSPEYSIDRIDSDGDYEPGNCRWATPTEQSRNRKSVVRGSPSIANAIRATKAAGGNVAEAARNLGVNKSTAHSIAAGRTWKEIV